MLNNSSKKEKNDEKKKAVNELKTKIKGFISQTRRDIYVPRGSKFNDILCEAFDDLLHHEYRQEYEKVLAEREKENKSAKNKAGNKDKIKPDNKDDRQSNINMSEDSQDAERLEVIKLVNEQRTKIGVEKLAVDQNLHHAAQIRAKEQVKLYSHTRPDGTSCFTALKESGISSYTFAGENIAMGQKDAAGVMNSWMNSSGHRKNILSSNFIKIGVGEYKDAQGKKYWTQMFIK